MAEGVVGVLIGKLGVALANEASSVGASLLCKEASALAGLFGEIREAKEELESMQAYLQGAERLRHTDETTGIFVKKIRGLAFEIEDVVDEFTYKLEDKHGGFAAKMKKRVKHVKTWRRLAHKLQDIRGRLQGAKERKKDYTMTEMVKYAGGSAHHAKTTDQSFHFTRDGDLVGIEENKEKLIQWLTGDLEQRSEIQSANLEQLSQSGATHLRALHVFESYINIDLLKPILTTSNLLSTLELHGARIKMLPNEVFNLFNLRFLGLRNTDVANLPEVIGRLQNLEVLDAFNTKLSNLPNNVVKLRKMRYLYAGAIGRGDKFEPFSGVKVPNGIRHLTVLQALQCVKASSEILREVAALTELRTFGVSDVKSEQCANLSSAINQMRHLVHLQITALGEKEVLQLEGLRLPPTISKLGLQGQLVKTSMPQVFSSWSHLDNLTMLWLSFSKIDEDSFSSLLALHGLRLLALRKAYEGKKLHFSARSFPKLHSLDIWGSPQLNQVEIEEGAMANLFRLVFEDCPNLKFLPHGIEHLTALEILYLEEVSEELVEKLREKEEPNECNEDLMKISHIRNVTVRLKQKGLWERIR